MRRYIVDTDAVARNLILIREKAGGAPVWAVVKGDGYGLGVKTMAELCRRGGVDRFAVTELREAEALREGGNPDEQILMLRPTDEPAELRRLLELGVICTVASQHDAVTLKGIAHEMGVRAKAHLKIDTGMGRYGFLPIEKEAILACYAYLDEIEYLGVYTHLHSAFCNKKSARLQAELLEQTTQMIAAAGFRVGEVHCANSSALFKLPELAMDGVRVGSAILGRLAFPSRLKRVGFCETSVEGMRWVPKGHTCGYGAGWKAKKPTQIAVLPVGWYHGFTLTYGSDLHRFRDSLREIFAGLKHLIAPPRLTVTIDGKKCRVLGHVGMLHTVVDVTGKKITEQDTAVVEINPVQLRGTDVVLV